ncbi:MAG TPA: PBP1A family penicillin-binding protein [Patescibacteria group bacterium]|nr:PBP1A family penicillin-binding protein [Patescibacteria group bacterium]
MRHLQFPNDRMKRIFRILGIAAKEIGHGIVIVALLLLLAVFTIGFYVYFTTPSADALLTRPVAQTTTIYDRSGTHVLYKIHGEENRKVIAHDDIPDDVRHATLAAEDDDFYDHIGVDFFSIARAFRENIRNSALEQGASTITQQLARNVFLSREKTFQRKFKEIVLALKIEQHYTKDEILDFYLNEVPYGSNAYGIQSAAETFFGKDAGDLSLDEAAFLAALPKATTYYSPYGNHAEELIARQKNILTRIAELGFADRIAIEQALAKDTRSRVMPFLQPIDAPHFVFYVKEQLEQKYGRDAVERGGLDVYTTLDYDLQKNAEKVLREGVIRNKAFGASNAALVSLDPTNGEVLAMVGSVDYFDQSIDGEVNVALRPRQPGSSFKPIAYAKAFEKGFQPETLLHDVRTNFGPDGSGKEYIPQNYTGQHYGLVSMRQALANSLNVPAVKTLYLAGIDATIDLAKRLGINTLTDRNRYGLSLVLGGGEVKLLELTGAFGVFANDGVRHEPQGILKIVDSTGVIYEKPKHQGDRVLNQDVARKINSILSDNAARALIFGTATPLTIPGQTVAAKTGTTQEFRDAWTIGYATTLATGVWVGNNDNRPMRAGSDGVYVAAPIWNAFMKNVLAGKKSEAFGTYEKLETDKAMLAGDTGGQMGYYNKKTGERISEEKASKMDRDKLEKKYSPDFHDILYYVNKDDPLGSSPNPDDPMALLWEKSLQNPQEEGDEKKQ